MQNESNDYKKLMLDTINEVYPKYLQEKVLKQLEAKCLISHETNLLTEGEYAVNVSPAGEEQSEDSSDQPVTEFEKINTAIQANSDCLKVIEENEYNLSYKYAALFEIPESLNVEVSLADLIQRGLVNDSRSNSFSGDHCSDFNSLDIIKPTYKVVNDEIVALKFNHVVTGYLAASGPNERTIKYSVLVLIYKNLNILEIRFDKIKGYLKNGDEYFYVKEVKTVLNWIEKFLVIEPVPLNLQPIIDHISRKDSADVNVTAQAMNLATGSKAILDTGVNDEFVLPLLGELKKLLKDNEELFNSNEETLEIMEKLDNFIFETEETSDLPWISLSWAHTTKSKIIKVKFSFNYMGQVYDLLQYYGNNAEMERMNNVTAYLIENKREYADQDIEPAEEGEAN